MADHNNPQSRNEEILIATIDGKEYNKLPQSRIEELLLELKETIEEGGGGGTDDYNDLKNQPKINNNTLVGNKTASDLGLVAAETGKGLSSNDYTNADKAIVGGVTAALAGKQNALTAGDYISIDAQNSISVNRDLVPHQISYRIKGTGRDTMNITKYIDGVQESSTDYTYQQGTTLTIDDAFTINDTYSSAGYIWQFVWLKDSTTHDKDYTVEYRSYEGAFDFTEVFNDEDLSGYKLVIKSEMDAALALKQNATDNSLQTTDKTVVGAVNELKSGLTNYENQNNLNLEVPNRKNVFPITLALLKDHNTDGTWSGNDYTVSGVTFACAFNSDGYLTSITANGTSTAYIYFRFYQRTINPLHLSGSFVVSGGLNNNAIFVVGRTYNGAWQVLGASKGGDSNPFTVALSDDIGANIEADNGTEFTNAMFYPMIRSATITDPTFAPYIPSVESRIEAVESGLTSLNTVTMANYGGFNIYKIGKIVLMIRGEGSVNTDASGQVLSDGVPLQLPESLRPRDIINIVETYTNKRVTIKMDGTITLPNDPSVSNLIIRLSAVWMTFS